MRALLFDFNGTLSDDERVQCEIFRELFAEHRPLSEAEYFDELAGLSDPEIVEQWLGADHPATAQLLEGRTRLFLERVGDGSTVAPDVREAVLRVVGRARLAVVSGAARSEVETVLRAAGIAVFDVIVSAEDVSRGKPDPEGYLRALDLLGLPGATSRRDRGHASRGHGRESCWPVLRRRPRHGPSRATRRGRRDRPPARRRARGPAARPLARLAPMCRNIRTLYNFEPPATREEVNDAALQYVRKISGFTKPSQANEVAFERAVEAVTAASARLLDELVTTAPPKNREAEAAKKRSRWEQRAAAV